MSTPDDLVQQAIAFFFQTALPEATGKHFADLPDPSVHLGSYAAWDGTPVQTRAGQPLTPAYALRVSPALAVTGRPAERRRGGRPDRGPGAAPAPAAQRGRPGGRRCGRDPAGDGRSRLVRVVARRPGRDDCGHRHHRARRPDTPGRPGGAPGRTPARPSRRRPGLRPGRRTRHRAGRGMGGRGGRGQERVGSGPDDADRGTGAAAGRRVRPGLAEECAADASSPTPRPARTTRVGPEAGATRRTPITCPRSTSRTTCWRNSSSVTSCTCTRCFPSRAERRGRPRRQRVPRDRRPLPTHRAAGTAVHAGDRVHRPHPAGGRSLLRLRLLPRRGRHRHPGGTEPAVEDDGVADPAHRLVDQRQACRRGARGEPGDRRHRRPPDRWCTWSRRSPGSRRCRPA